MPEMSILYCQIHLIELFYSNCRYQNIYPSDCYEQPRTYTDMDGQSRYDTITNNYIDHVACEYQDMVGIGAMLPQHMTIANNEIGCLPYTGINRFAESDICNFVVF